MLNDDDDRWICISDLFAGLMAFFIFVTAGIVMENSALESSLFDGIAPVHDRIEAGNATSAEVGLPEGKYLADDIFVKDDTFYIGSAYFKDDHYKLTKKQKAGLKSAINEIARINAKNKRKNKLLFIGYSSCNYNGGDEISSRKASQSLTEIEKRDRYIASYGYNYRLSVERAYAMYYFFLSNPKISRSFEVDNLRYVGRSEEYAASAQGDMICTDRMKDTNAEEAFRTVVVKICDEWPLMDISEFTKRLQQQESL